MECPCRPSASTLNNDVIFYTDHEPSLDDSEADLSVIETEIIALGHMLDLDLSNLPKEK